MSQMSYSTSELIKLTPNLNSIMRNSSCSLACIVPVHSSLKFTNDHVAALAISIGIIMCLVCKGHYPGPMTELNIVHKCAALCASVLGIPDCKNVCRAFQKWRRACH